MDENNNGEAKELEELDREETAEIAEELAEPSEEEGKKQGFSTEGKLAAWFGLGLTIVICVGVGIMFLKLGIFESVDIIRGWVNKLGWFGPIAVCLAQVAQVILRFVPGGVTCAASVLIYGPLWGFVISYIGLIVGCVLVYVLVHRYGIRIAERLAGRENLEKYWKWASGKKFDVLFLVTAILPFFPDDLICVAASLTKISFKKYFIICVIGRPVGLIIYSLAGAGIFSWLNIDMLA